MSFNTCKQVTVQFTADGTSNALSFDITRPPVFQDTLGNAPVDVVQVVATSGFTGPLGLVAVLSNPILTITFNNPPPQLDGTSALIVYTLTFLLRFTGA